MPAHDDPYDGPGALLERAPRFFAGSTSVAHLTGSITASGAEPQQKGHA